MPYYKIGLFSKYLPNFFNTGTNFYEQNNYQSKIDEASLQISETRYDAFCVKGEAVLKMYTEFEGIPQGGELNSYKTQNIGTGKFKVYDMIHNKVLEVSVTNEGNITQSVRLMTVEEQQVIPQKAEAVIKLTEDRYKQLLNDPTKEPVFEDKTKNCLAMEAENFRVIDPAKFQNFIRELTGDNSELSSNNVSSVSKIKQQGIDFC